MFCSGSANAKTGKPLKRLIVVQRDRFTGLKPGVNGSLLG